MEPNGTLKQKRPNNIGIQSNTSNNTIWRLYRSGQFEKKVNQIIQQILLTKKKQVQLKRKFFWAKQTDKETREDYWEKLIELKNTCGFPNFSTEQPKLKFIPSIADRKPREKQLKEKYLKVSKVVEQIQQFTYDRKNNKIPYRNP